MSLTKLVAGAKGDVNNSNGADVASAVNGLIDGSGASNPVIWLGIDSLTAGAGGFFYNLPLEKFARGVVGWGGRIVPFIGSSQSISNLFECSVNNNSNTRLIRELPTSSDARVNSLADRGVYCDGDVAGFLNAEIIPEFNWVSADVYYLQQPNGGSFVIDRPSGVSIDVDTSGVLEVKKVTVRNDNRVSGASVRCYNTSIGAGNNVVLYEALFKSGDNGPVWLNVAEGGRTTKTQSGNENDTFNQVIQKSWIDALGVTHAVVQAGVNDAASSYTASEFSGYLSDLVDGSLSDVDCTIVRPTQPDPASVDMSTYVSVYESYQASGYPYVDLVGELGDFAYCDAAGLMIDGFHTSNNYQYLMGQVLCNKLFGRCFYIDTPPIIDYAGTDSQEVISGSFKSL